MDKLGVTATELFVNNPYRVLGIPVNATEDEIDERYSALFSMCEDGTIGEFSSPYDAPYLPSIVRNVDTLAEAREKVFSNGYRAFAYADSMYAYDPSQTDISILIENIDSYDSFLNCYIWLVLHDRNIMYKSMWFKLAKYIDELICSESDRWAELFDSRYPEEIYTDDPETLEAFYSIFCEIILLPLKELVKGSMECQSAVEVLSVRMFENLGNGTEDLHTLAEKASEAEKKNKKVSPRSPVMKGISLTDAYLAEQKSEEKAGNGESGSISLVEGLDENNIYNDALFQMLKANKAKRQVIQELNTDVIFGSGNLGKEEDVKLTMQTVNTKAMDEKRLKSPYALATEEMTLEEKYADVNINDMLDPKLPYSSMRDVFSGSDKNEFEENMSSQRSGQKLFVLIIVLFILGMLGYFGYTHWDEIKEFVNDLLF